MMNIFLDACLAGPFCLLWSAFTCLDVGFVSGIMWDLEARWCGLRGVGHMYVHIVAPCAASEHTWPVPGICMCHWQIGRLAWGIRETVRTPGGTEQLPECSTADAGKSLAAAPSRGLCCARHVRDSRHHHLAAAHIDEATAAQILAATKRQAVPGALMRWVMSTSASRSYQALEDTCTSLITAGTAAARQQKGAAHVRLIQSIVVPPR